MPVRQRLTKRVVEALEPPQHGSTLAFDTEVKGFAVRVRRGRSGAQARVWRTYVFRYQEGYGRKASRDRWLKIGEHGEEWSHVQTGRAQALTVEAARTMASWLRGVRNGGGDPRAALRPASPAPPDEADAVPTLRAFKPVYIEKHAAAHKCLRAVKEDARLLDRHVLPTLGGIPIDQITRAMVTDMHLAMKGTPVNANRVLSLLSKVLSVARDRGVLPENHYNPCRDVKKFRELKRDRYLSPTELLAIGAGLRALRLEVGRQRGVHHLRDGPLRLTRSPVLQRQLVGAVLQLRVDPQGRRRERHSFARLSAFRHGPIRPQGFRRGQSLPLDTPSRALVV